MMFEYFLNVMFFHSCIIDRKTIEFTIFPFSHFEVLSDESRMRCGVKDVVVNQNIKRFIKSHLFNLYLHRLVNSDVTLPHYLFTNNNFLTINRPGS